MLKKEFRLKSNSAFHATYKIKNSYFEGGIILYVGKKKTDNTFPTKVGFVVSKKVHKRSVKRNRIKRLMRESMRLLQKEGHFSSYEKYLSLIFIGSDRILDKNINQVYAIVKKLLLKLEG